MNYGSIFLLCALLCVPVVIIVGISVGVPRVRSFIQRRRQAHFDFVVNLSLSINQLATLVSDLKKEARGCGDEVVLRLIDDAAIYLDFAGQALEQHKYHRAWRLIDQGNVYVRYARSYLA